MAPVSIAKKLTPISRMTISMISEPTVVASYCGSERGHRGDGPVGAVPFGEVLVAGFEGAEHGAADNGHHRGHQRRVEESLVGEGVS